MALFGFSPLVISLVANRFFTHPESGLDVTHFLGFLAVAAGIMHLFSAACMQGPEPKHAHSRLGHAPEGEEDYCNPSENVDTASDGEAQPLLDNNKPMVTAGMVPIPEPQHGSVGDLLKDPYFWILFSVLVILIGGVCICIIYELLAITFLTPFPGRDGNDKPRFYLFIAAFVERPLSRRLNSRSTAICIKHPDPSPRGTIC